MGNPRRERRKQQKRERQDAQNVASVPIDADMPPDGYSQKLLWADAHIDALDKAIQGWLDGGGYTLVDKPDAETGYHVLYAQIKDPASIAWGLMAGDAVHNLRSALDHLAYAILDRHLGGVPPDIAERADFLIMSPLNRSGQPRVTPELDFSSNVKGSLGSDLPDGLEEALRDLQPYQRGEQFRDHELWLIHDLDRVDKHRHLHVVTAAANLSELSMGGYFERFWWGGGVVKDGDKVSEWSDPVGPGAHLNVGSARKVVLGKPEAGAGRELVPLLRALRDYVDSDVMPSLATFL